MSWEGSQALTLAAAGSKEDAVSHGGVSVEEEEASGMGRVRQSFRIAETGKWLDINEVMQREGKK